MPSRFVELAETSSTASVFGTFDLPIAVITNLVAEWTNWTDTASVKDMAESTLTSVNQAAQDAANIAVTNAPPPGVARWFLSGALVIFVLRCALLSVHRRIIFHAHTHSKRY